VVDAGKITLSIGTSIHDAEKALLLATLEYTNNNRRRTAEILGLSLKTIQIKLKEYRTTESQESMIAAASK
jgi:DNA-binding NtrC family response regulator